jgi:hypothetical protein
MPLTVRIAARVLIGVTVIAGNPSSFTTVNSRATGEVPEMERGTSCRRPRRFTELVDSL